MLLEVGLTGLIAFGVAQTIAWREGPFKVFERLRDSLVERGGFEIYTDPTTQESERRPASSFARLFQCPYCVGVWGAFFAAFLFADGFRGWIILWLAGLGIQVILQNVADYLVNARVEDYE